MGKSRATRPTRDQKIRIAAAGLDARNWLVIADTEVGLHLVHRRTGTSRKLKKDSAAATARVR